VYAKVPKLWPESTIVCIGGGPSLTPEDVATVQGRAHVIAINDAYKIAPFAEVLYAADARWWRHHAGVPSFKGFKYTLQAEARRWPGVQVLRNTGQSGLERDARGLKTGRNGGYQAINLAVHLGARRVLLLGYDMKSGGKGKSHWFGDHPWGSSSPYGSFLRCFETIVEPLQQAGVTVINCSRQTALTAFQRMTIDEALALESAA
jgi:hypothetical protein